MPIIQIENIIKSYQMGEGELRALKGVSLSIEAGEFVSIVGHSGSGKSTLMQIMGLLDRPTSGRYLLFGRDVSNLSDDEGASLRSQILGFVFQQFHLLSRTSTLNNVVLPMIYTGQKDREGRGKELLKMVNLSDRMDHKPNQLSGGQQQRVAIARALVNKPKILFADEPTGNLASDQAKDILKLLAELNRQGITVILVTHDMEIAACARRMIRLKDGLIVEDKMINVDIAKQKVSHGLKNIDTNLKTGNFTLAELREHVISAFHAIAANKVRSALSVLGVLIGVAAVIAMLSIGAGAQESIKARLASLGSNVLMLFPGAPNTRGIMGATGDYTRLTLDDVKAVQQSSSYISNIYGEVEGQHIRAVYKDRNSVVEVQGVPINYESIRSATPTSGRFFTEQEDANRDRVALIGTTVLGDLFPNENPIGATIRINRVNFKVVGVLPTKGASGFSDQDAMIVIPLQTAMKRLLNTDYLHEMAIQCESPESIPTVIDDVTVMLRKRHKLPSFKENDFTLRNNAETQAALSDTTKTMALFLFSMAVISLLVGGIGIMNIMIVSVNERTKEIGLRKAIGAPRRAILAQFLLEASTLSMLGGLMGIALGIGTDLILSNLAGWNAIVTLQSILLAFGFSAGVGMIFGFWPAYQASLRSPIEALRYS